MTCSACHASNECCLKRFPKTQQPMEQIYIEPTDGSGLSHPSFPRFAIHAESAPEIDAGPLRAGLAKPMSGFLWLPLSI